MMYKWKKWRKNNNWMMSFMRLLKLQGWSLWMPITIHSVVYQRPSLCKVLGSRVARYSFREKVGAKIEITAHGDMDTRQWWGQPQSCSPTSWLPASILHQEKTGLSTRDPKEKTLKRAHRGSHVESWECAHLQATGQRTEDSLPRYILGPSLSRQHGDPL